MKLGRAWAAGWEAFRTPELLAGAEQVLSELASRADSAAEALFLLGTLRQPQGEVDAAQADVRENVLSLRTTLAGDAGLLDSLKEYVAEFQIQTNMQVEFLNTLQQPPQLSPLAEALR